MTGMTRNRVHKGIPTGGEFSANDRAEAAVELESAPPAYLEVNKIFRGQQFFLKSMEKWPALYATENVPLSEKVIHGHFFGGGCDWYIAEYDPTTGEAFGYADLGTGDAEWGYINLREIEATRATANKLPLIFERDAHFRPDVARAVIPEVKAAWQADRVTLGTAPARTGITGDEVTAEVEARAEAGRQISDPAALHLARMFGKEGTELSLVGASGHGSRKNMKQELNTILRDDPRMTDAVRAHLEALAAWVKFGGDNN